jgi:hypothetical protein
LDDILVSLLFFQSLSPIVCLAIALLNQKKKIDYFFQIDAIQAYIRHKTIKLWQKFSSPAHLQIITVLSLP